MLWMDVVRGEATLLVIGFHSTGLLRYGDTPTPSGMTKFNSLSEPFRLPAFSFLAGMLADSSLHLSERAYYGHKARTVLYPFAVWTVVYGVVLREPATLHSAARLATGGTYLFFLGHLFGFNAIHYPLRQVDPRVLSAAALAAGAVSSSLLPRVPDRFTRRFGYLLAMYMLGRSASLDPDRWRALQSSRVTLISGAGVTVVAALVAVRTDRLSYRWEWAWVPALAMVVFARAAERIEAAAVSRPLRFVGRNAIVFYTAHFPVAYVVVRRMRGRGDTSGWRTLAVTLSAAIGVPSALAHARSRSRTVRRLFSL